MKSKKVIVRFLRAFLILVLLVLIYLVVDGYITYKTASEGIKPEEAYQEFSTSDYYVALEDIPDIYKKAVIASEDHRFYYHFGIDFIGLGRAIFNDIKHLSYVEGGSTITQQLTKNLYFTGEKRITRKIAEAIAAFDFEAHLTKEQILELYINNCYFGNGYYGLREAAIGYYGKEPNELTDFEATLLAGVPNAPSIYNPEANYDLSLKRQAIVLSRMVKYGYITQDDADKIKNNN